MPGATDQPGGDPAAARPPPPPPLPSGLSPGEDASLASGRRSRLRNFNWEALPAERVRGRRNLWTLAAGRRGAFPLDFQLLEELFEQRPEPPGGPLRAQPAEQASLLDSKKILNLGIFLKQFKRPAQEIVADIRDGVGTLYGAEKLLELLKMLPDEEEVKNLVAFQGDKSRLSEAEVFALLLVQVPSYAHRLELLVLKEEFFPHLNSLQSAIQILTEAALELLDCEELHDLIRLVLRAGNYMNEGGYAGSALGFRMPSLLRLADTKANRPGVDLLHFVASEVEKKDPTLLLFPSKLQHVGAASRIVEQEVVVELEKLGQRLSEAQRGLEAQMEPFFCVASAELSVVKASLEGLRQTAAMLCSFLCEEPESFSLPACCGIFHVFGERFLAAVQENRAQEAAERRRQRQERERLEKQKRRSIATCSARDPGLQDVELDLLFFWAPPPGRRSRALRGPAPATGSPQARKKPLPLSQRRRRRCHTLTLLPPCPEPASPAPPGSGKREGLFGQGLKALLTSPPPPARLPSQGPLLLASPSGLCPKNSLPEGPKNPLSPPAHPKGVSALVGFFRRLGSSNKPRHTSQA